MPRELPTPAFDAGTAAAPRAFTSKGRVVNGWVEVCVSGLLPAQDMIRFDHERSTYAIYRSADGRLFASDGVCTHGRAHLAEGLVTGNLVECPKHHGRFDYTDGSAKRLPACEALRTFPVREHDRKIFLQLSPFAQTQPDGPESRGATSTHFQSTAA